MLFCPLFLQEVHETCFSSCPVILVHKKRVDVINKKSMRHAFVHFSGPVLSSISCPQEESTNASKGSRDCKAADCEHGLTKAARPRIPSQLPFNQALAKEMLPSVMNMDSLDTKDSFIDHAWRLPIRLPCQTVSCVRARTRPQHPNTRTPARP